MGSKKKARARSTVLNKERGTRLRQKRAFYFKSLLKSTYPCLNLKRVLRAQARATETKKKETRVRACAHVPSKLHVRVDLHVYHREQKCDGTR